MSTPPPSKTNPSLALPTTQNTIQPAKAAVVKSAPATKKSATVPSPLFPSTPKSLRIGGAVRPQGRDLSRFVRWPRYVRLQRQKKILLQRLKVPPTLQQFKRTLDKNQASELFKLLDKYKPETEADKRKRIDAKAAGGGASATSAPVVLKYGLKHITTLIESKKAKLVVIAHDVDPIELVVWLPALCRKMDVPYAIVKGKSRLGVLTHKKNSACVALTAVNKDDESKLKSLQENFRIQFNEHVEKKWGGGIMGLKTQARLRIRHELLLVEEKKKLESRARL